MEKAKNRDSVGKVKVAKVIKSERRWLQGRNILSTAHSSCAGTSEQLEGLEKLGEECYKNYT